MNLNYALKENGLVFIDDVETGIKCRCKCPDCGELLIAKNNGKIKEHHFAHQSGNECKHGYETMIHLLAKEVIKNEKRILLPRLYAETSDHNKIDYLLEEEIMATYNHVELEKRISDIIPDVIAYDIEGTPLLIEIMVTHGIDSDKLEKIVKLGIDTIEIDLSSYEILDYESMLKVVTQEIRNKKWIFNKSSKFFGNKLMSFCEKRPIIRRGFALHVDNCPHNVRIYRGKSYANVIDHCMGCQDNITETCFDEEIYCIGKLQISSKEEIDLISEVIKENGIIKCIKYKNGNTLDFNETSNEGNNLKELWEQTNEPFLAKNIVTGVAVFITTNPVTHYNKYGKCYGYMYKNGYSIGSREIYGAFDNQWEIIKNR